MARKLLNDMNLPGSTAHVFSARNLHCAKDVLCKTELELMEMLDMPWPLLSAALARIHECVCPPCHSVLSLWQERNAKEIAGGRLVTGLRELDRALGGGIPFGLITEVVGPAGVGKSQMCHMLSVLAAMPTTLGGLDGSVVYIDTERKFSSARMMEIATTKFPEIFRDRSMMQQLAVRILVLHPSCMSELMQSLQELEKGIIEHSVCLLIIDSVAALLLSEYGNDRIVQRQEMLGHQASLLKFLAESFRIPVIVTNQVRGKSTNPWVGQPASISSQVVHNVGIPVESGEGGLEQHLTAALGTKWAHSVNIRLLLENSPSGQRQIKIAKSPMSASVSFPFCVTSGGVELAMDQFSYNPY